MVSSISLELVHVMGEPYCTWSEPVAYSCLSFLNETSAPVNNHFMGRTQALLDSPVGICQHMMTSCHGNSFCINGPLWRESGGHRWIPYVKGIHLWLVNSPDKDSVMWSFDDFFFVSLNMLLNKRLGYQSFKKPWCLLDATAIYPYAGFGMFPVSLLNAFKIYKNHVI